MISHTFSCCLAFFCSLVSPWKAMEEVQDSLLETDVSNPFICMIFIFFLDDFFFSDFLN